MGDKTWKRLERGAATQIGGQRQPSQGVPAPDILGPGPWSWEHKARKTLPKWLLEAIAQAEKHDDPSGVIITYHPQQGKPVERYVLVKIETMAEILGDQYITSDRLRAL